MKIYCSGIGGIGLSAYAAFMHELGHEVLGSDRTKTDITQSLEDSGITVFYDQSGNFMPTDCDLLVYTEAVPPEAPERAKAVEHAITQISYFMALGELTKEYYVIAVCGTHGKSSTTAMAAQALIESGIDANVIVGTKVPYLHGKNWRKGTSNIFIVEACEYRRSFSYLSPNCILLTNAHGDHYDYYKDQQDYTNAFADFIQSLPDDGTLITHGNEESCSVLMPYAKHAINADEFTLPTTGVIGEHMQKNAQLVVGLSRVVPGVSEESIRLALQNYTGTWRRLETIGQFKNCTVIDDYGHHPNEIRANLAAIASAYTDKQVVIVFQPHMHSRTKELYTEFITAFTDANLLILADTYEPRKEDIDYKIDIEAFAEDIRHESAVNVVTEKHFDQLVARIQSLHTDGTIQPNAVIVFMGAGTITNAARALVQNSSSN